MEQARQLHIFFFPFIARGHMIPMLGAAKLLAERGVLSTIVTTPGNASLFRSVIEDAVLSGHSMKLLFVPFPDVGLPPGCESTFDVPPGADSMKIPHAMKLLHQPLQDLLREHRPDCIVGDLIVTETARVAHNLGLPYVQFRAYSAFSGVVIDTLFRTFTSGGGHEVALESGMVGPVTGLPHRIVLRRSELPQFLNLPPEQLSGLDLTTEKVFGVMVNTFRELEPEYVELSKEGGSSRVWCVGPVHSTKSDCSWEGIKRWLDSREVESVLYVAFGSECRLGHEQLREISSGLESSLQPFILAVKGAEEWLPEGFRENVGKRGLILTEWVPQTSILNHPAIGGILTHCGWNSVMEAIGVGIPMIVWPLHSDHFVCERLLVEVLQIGVRVLDGEMRIIDPEKKKVISGEKVTAAIVKFFGGGEEVKEMRRKTKEYAKLSGSARKEGGSSFADINCFIEDLRSYCASSGEETTSPRSLSS